jgi:hypothetical protein
MWTAMRSGCQKSLSSGCKWNLNTELVRVYDWLCVCMCVSVMCSWIYFCTGSKLCHM